MVQGMRKELLGREPEVVPQIDSAVILDRQVDLVSPLVTQLTYEVATKTQTFCRVTHLITNTSN